MRFAQASIILFTIAACARSEETRPIGEHRPSDRTDRAAEGLIVHEWGTYTSVQSSDGRTMEGLQHAEELLPAFVHARNPQNPDQKGIGPSSEPVTQKLETPVLYFYGRADHADVTVRFPPGLISEWFPEASEMSPPIAPDATLQNGSMRWSVDLVSADQIRAPVVPEDSIWAPSRRVSSLGVKSGQEEERFIFYRGLARFERPIRARGTGRGTIDLANDSSEHIPAAFLLRVDESGGAIAEIGAIGAGETRSVVTSLAMRSIEEYRLEARTALARALEASGLYKDEAEAMVDTWNHSYFLNPGTRVLYVAPRAWTDELLPIEIEPSPVELVRTLVGRIEVMLPEEEQAIVNDLTLAASGQKLLGIDAYGRFTEPKLRRAVELISDPRVRAYAQWLVDQCSRLP
jgi:hypothetical protein